MNLYRFKINGDFYHGVSNKIGEALDMVLLHTGLCESQVETAEKLEDEITVKYEDNEG